MAKVKNLSYYRYLAEVIRVKDGDTWILAVSQGFGNTFTSSFRQYEFDTPETTWRAFNEFEYTHGLAATEYVRTLMEGRTVGIQTYKSKAGAYGRWEASVFILDDDLNPVDKLADLLAFNNLRKLPQSEYNKPVILKPFVYTLPK